MCTVLMPPGVNPIAVKKISHISDLSFTKERNERPLPQNTFLSTYSCFLSDDGQVEQRKHVVENTCAM